MIHYAVAATKNNCMKEIIRSKEKLIIAIRSFGCNKKRVVSQENCNAPTNAITTGAPIKFVWAVGAACPTADQGPNIIPAADPSAQAVSVSKKRKKHGATGQKEARSHTTERSTELPERMSSIVT